MPKLSSSLYKLIKIKKRKLFIEKNWKIKTLQKPLSSSYKNFWCKTIGIYHSQINIYKFVFKN